MIEELFKQEIEWHLHTSMTYDYAYEATLYSKCNDIAVFYDAGRVEEKDDLGRNNCSRAVEPELLRKVMGVCYKVDSFQNKKRQVFHAKISLVKYCSGKYKLVVWSKNHGFSAGTTADIGVIFDLSVDEPCTDDAKNISEENGSELKRYLEKIYCGCMEENGKNWLKDRGLININGKAGNTFSHVTLKYKDCQNIRLMFGGCGTADSLAERMMKLSGKTVFEPRITLTPPIFVHSSYKNEIKEIEKFKEFCKKMNLYETKSVRKENYPKASHIKLYLFDNFMFFGSANATKSGIGYDLRKLKKSIESVECLVGIPIESEVSDSIQNEIEENYEPFEKFQFKHYDDEFALYVMKNWKLKNICFKDKNDGQSLNSKSVKKIEFQFVKENENSFTDENGDEHKIKISPIEYEFANELNIINSANLSDSFTVTVKNFKEFFIPMGYLIVSAENINTGKKKRYLWNIGTDKIPKDFQEVVHVEKENIVSRLFNSGYDLELIRKIQEEDVKYCEKSEYVAFFDALLEENK